MVLKITFLIFVAIMFIVPGATFFAMGGVRSDGLFRLFGLYALTLLWLQIILGPFTLPLLKAGFNVFPIHRAIGISALILAILHPALFLSAATLETYLPANLLIFGYLGPIALLLLITTATTALLMGRAPFSKFWRFLHPLNYLVFTLVLVHSFMVGTETQFQPLRSLYIIYAGTLITSFSYRVIYRRFLQK
ncbi:hypothetical protein A2617_02675 [Candidatus Daviesbacteria bacterium RIFOXYD1_FULL_41_10]|uniref:Ferric oxidoreductase domain-containing protein n=2 Tax=Candidatus Daviesiibacteriota TaxID=1752718 RepID=A0A1F5N1L1_9BACT|nr:MAG: hypothetical protein UU67_C0029G0016 [Candidatus Daviesbacteria bacterium GW2011_GWB1_41_5]OGE71505.1 MAG: hypothetical protein A2617_02675 [Candidatus Daviesbacteria bacterium RIFOXYD1_FULL_41_10]